MADTSTHLNACGFLLWTLCLSLTHAHAQPHPLSPTRPAASTPLSPAAAPIATARATPGDVANGTLPATGPTLTLHDALRSTLQRHPAIALSRSSVAASRAEIRAARAPFDPVLNTAFGHHHYAQALLPAERLAPSERALLTDITSWSVGAAAGFEWGMTVAPTLTLERAKSTRDPNPAGFPTDPVQRARAELTLLQPLLRGRGTSGAASELHAAERSYEAAEHAAAHTAQAQVFDAIVAYYRFVAANENLTGLSNSVARARLLFDETQRLVEAEHRTRADLRQVQASLENQTSGLLAAQSDLALARYDLALAMGLEGRTLPEWVPGDDFPSSNVPEGVVDSVVDSALRARRDLRAADQTAAAAAVLVAGAERNALPALDLGVSVGYMGALDRDGVGSFFASTAHNVPGVTAGATLTLKLPINNDAANAARDLRRADQDSALIRRADIDRQVRTGVRSALGDVQLSAAALAAAERALAVLTQLVVDERDKLHEGLSTIIDVVLTEERLTLAELTRTARRLRYVTARARLQFESGALPEVESALLPTAEALLTPQGNHGTN